MHLRISALLAVAAALALPRAHADYMNSCHGAFMSRDGYTLQASCWKNNKDIVSASLDLNKCIANYNGNLACAKNGGFSGSCNVAFSNLSSDGRTFACKCGGPQGQHITSVPIANCLVNDKGKLHC